MPLMSRLHPIQVVARRTGLTPDVLRAWEKRYGAVTPARSSGSHRLYTDEEVERLGLLRRATVSGRAIGQVARLSTRELRSLVEGDEAAARGVGVIGPREPNRPGARSEADPGLHLRACRDAVRNMDVAGLEGALSRGSLDLSRVVLVDELLLPLMRSIGDEWHDGSLRVAHEHLASAVVRTLLGNLASQRDVGLSSPRLVAATPAGQVHEFGALVAVATAASDGWGAAYLGSSLPAEEIAAASRQTGARAVALSIVHPPDDPRLPAELLRLRRDLPEGTALLAGGASVAAYAPTLAQARAEIHPDMHSFREALERLRSGGS